MSMLIVSIADHYWEISGSSSEVYQSKTNTMIPFDDPDYNTWKTQRGMSASKIANVAELATVVQNLSSPLPHWLFNAPSFIQPTATTYDKPQLCAYAADARSRKGTGGFTITSLSAAPFASDPVSRNTLANANEYAKVTPNDMQWKLSDGTFITMSPANLTTAAGAMANFVQLCFNCESDTVASINSGTITTLTQIDSAFDAIANVVP